MCSAVKWEGGTGTIKWWWACGTLAMQKSSVPGWGLVQSSSTLQKVLRSCTQDLTGLQPLTLLPQMNLLLREYLLSGEVSEAERCLRQLEVPHFHHELVYEVKKGRSSPVLELVGREHTTIRLARPRAGSSRLLGRPVPSRACFAGLRADGNACLAHSCCGFMPPAPRVRARLW